MRPKPQVDPEFMSCPKSRGRLSLPRSLGRLMILIALLGLALGVYSERVRPGPAPFPARLVAFLPPRTPPTRALTRLQDPSVLVARQGIDDAMIHTARRGIDDAMIVNPGRMARVPIFIVPRSGGNQPPLSPTPTPRTPQPR